MITAIVARGRAQVDDSHGGLVTPVLRRVTEDPGVGAVDSLPLADMSCVDW
jgi:hypothetical protein